jgi:hypothetical protein
MRRNLKTFWMTTGMFPQELLIDLKSPMAVNEVQMISTGSKK